MNYDAFLDQKTQLGGEHGFPPQFMPDSAFDFQRFLIEWSLVKGRSAVLADCGLGKTLIELAWAQNVAQHTGGRVLILTPLAVTHQHVCEGVKFGIECQRSTGKLDSQIVVTNYEQLHHFSAEDFTGAVCDESSILKNFDGVTKSMVTDFMRKLPYRLLCTATPAPNDFIELGTSSEALGELGFMDMLSRFFKKDGKTLSRSDELRSGIWRFRGHAEREFWRWVCSWARACRRPSDLRFDDAAFELPELVTREHIVSARAKNPDFLFSMAAQTLQEQREERRRTLIERCERAAELICDHKNPAVAWCHLNDEGDLLEKLIPGCVQVSGKDSDDEKEEKFIAFVQGKIRVMVSKGVIAGWGLNWQHCAHQTFFPSHSFEQWYQCIRRSWRFGQKNPVIIDVVASEGEVGVLANLKRKAEAADKMFAQLVEFMNNELHIRKKTEFTELEEIPLWL